MRLPRKIAMFFLGLGMAVTLTGCFPLFVLGDHGGYGGGHGHGHGHYYGGYGPRR